MKFIHIADVHLGVVPDAGKSWSEKRAADIWTTFTEVFAVAKKIKVDMVLIAGDLFHRQPLIRELREINYIFEQVPEIQDIFLCKKCSVFKKERDRKCLFPGAEYGSIWNELLAQGRDVRCL